MKVTFKLFASLTEYLPAGTRDHQTQLDVPSEITPNQLIDGNNVPRKLAHLVVLNGVYVPPADRDQPILKDGDTLAVWPPVAGG